MIIWPCDFGPVGGWCIAAQVHGGRESANLAAGKQKDVK